jgi:hypothetical protein
MQSKDIPAAADRLRGVEQYILYLLTEGGPPVWAMDDLARECADPEDARIAVRNLQGSGLLHATGTRHVFASRAATRMVEITEHVI